MTDIIRRPHDHQWVHPRIAIGSALWSDEDVRSIRASGTTHVIDCQSTASAQVLYVGTPITHFHCGTDDPEARTLKGDEWFRRGVSYAISTLEHFVYGRILVHCAAGVNRGPSMAYAILRAIGKSQSEAESAIRIARPFVKLRYMGDAERWLREEWWR